MKLVFGRDALLLGSVRILEHRDGHWSDSMRSFAAKSSRTLNSLSRGCGRMSVVVDSHSFCSSCDGIV